MRSKYAFKSSIPTAPPKTTIRDRVRRKGSIKSLGKELYTSSDRRDHSRNFIKFFLKNLNKNSGLTVELREEIQALYKAVLTLNRQR